MAPRSTLPKEHKMLMGRSARKRLHAHSINDNIEAYAKKLFNNRQSKNQAAPEPIFVARTRVAMDWPTGRTRTSVS